MPKGKFPTEDYYNKVRLRDNIKTKYIVEINGLLAPRHRSRIEGTPFKWCLHLERALDISCPLLKEMLRHWVPNRNGFRVRQNLVPFSSVGVCICLGLSVVGSTVEFDNDLGGEVGAMFDGERVTAKGIIRMIKSIITSEDDDVDNVCRLYILLCFAVFYFPTTSPLVRNVPFTLLDNLDNLNNYNWATATYNLVSSGLSRSYEVLAQQQNAYAISLVGCVPVLQLWAVERLSLGPVVRDYCFPKFLSWPSVKIRTTNIELAFENNQIVWEWCLTEEQRMNDIVRIALNHSVEVNNTEAAEDVNLNGESSVSSTHKLGRNERRIDELKDEVLNIRRHVFGSSTVFDEGAQSRPQHMHEEPKSSPCRRSPEQAVSYHCHHSGDGVAHEDCIRDGDHPQSRQSDNDGVEAEICHGKEQFLCG